jgi:phenylalanyl-tRNA synthetase beta subunit
LLDFFENPQWQDQRSLTFRFLLVDEHKTMTKEEIDLVWQHVVRAVQDKGGQVR